MDPNHNEKLDHLVETMINGLSDYAFDGHIQEAKDALDAGHTLKNM